MWSSEKIPSADLGPFMLWLRLHGYLIPSEDQIQAVYFEWLATAPPDGAERFVRLPARERKAFTAFLSTDIHACSQPPLDAGWFYAANHRRWRRFIEDWRRDPSLQFIARTVFRNMDDLDVWMVTRQRNLGDSVPAHLLTSGVGRQLVLRALKAHGAPQRAPRRMG